MPRRIMPGAVMVRKWKGQAHRVTVLEDGFAYEGKLYESLSEIARLITGTRWNGPRFFGLRTGKEASQLVGDPLAPLRLSSTSAGRKEISQIQV